MKRFAIIVAGGTGKRMGASIPKQFLLLDNKPIIFHTIQKFAGIADRMIVVLPQEQIPYFKKLQTQYSFTIAVDVAVGGQERFHSVQNGLALLPNEPAVVAIHDAVRPLISKELIEKSYAKAELMSNCILAVACKDSIRHVTNSGNSAVSRQEYYLIQTPQVFALSLLKSAYEVPFDNFTDDASVFEHAGHHINIEMGAYSNIKITTPEDLLIAEALLRNEAPSF